MHFAKQKHGASLESGPILESRSPPLTTPHRGHQTPDNRVPRATQTFNQSHMGEPSRKSPEADGVKQESLSPCSQTPTRTGGI